MKINEIRERLSTIESKLIRIQQITSFITLDMFKEDSEMGVQFLDGGESMSDYDSEKSKNVTHLWEEIQKTLPSGFSVDGNLLRHLGFNQSKDWWDISNRDIPRELIKVNEYKQRLNLIELIESLHPEVARIVPTLLNDDVELALKGLYSGLDTYIRVACKTQKSDSTYQSIAKAFKDKILITQHEDDSDAVRNFLQGVIGYYRNNIVHRPLSQNAKILENSLGLIYIADRAFKLCDTCKPNLK